MKKKLTWFVYIVECSDGSLYCGSTPDVDRRVDQHNRPGSRIPHTKKLQPVREIARSSGTTKARALELEQKIKQLPRSQKIRTLKSWHDCPSVKNILTKRTLCKYCDQVDFNDFEKDKPVEWICSKGKWGWREESEIPEVNDCHDYELDQKSIQSRTAHSRVHFHSDIWALLVFSSDEERESFVLQNIPFVERQPSKLSARVMQLLPRFQQLLESGDPIRAISQKLGVSLTLAYKMRDYVKQQ